MLSSSSSSVIVPEEEKEKEKVKSKESKEIKAIFQPDFWRRVIKHMDEYQAAHLDYLFGGILTKEIWQDMIMVSPDIYTWIYAVKHRLMGLLFYLQHYKIPIQNVHDESHGLFELLLQWSINMNHLDVVLFLTHDQIPIYADDEQIISWRKLVPKLDVAAISGYTNMLYYIYDCYQGLPQVSRFIVHSQQVLCGIIKNNFIHTFAFLVPRIISIQDIRVILYAIKYKNSHMIESCMKHIDTSYIHLLSAEDLLSIYSHQQSHRNQTTSLAEKMITMAIKTHDPHIVQHVWNSIQTYMMISSNANQKIIFPFHQVPFIFDFIFKQGSLELLTWFWENQKQYAPYTCSTPSAYLLHYACQQLYLDHLLALPADFVVSDTKKCWNLIINKLIETRHEQNNNNNNNNNKIHKHAEKIIAVFQWLYNKNQFSLVFDRHTLMQTIRTGQALLVNYVFELGNYVPSVIDQTCKFMMIEYGLIESIEFFMILEVHFHEPEYLFNSISLGHLNIVELLLKQYTWSKTVLQQAEIEIHFCMDRHVRQACQQLIKQAMKQE
jgi:hypothetical protein